jgi:IS5 family transposase
MPGKQAKVVTPPMLKRMLRKVSRSSSPARDRAMILLSIKAVILPEMEAQIGASLSRIVANRGYRGHNAPPEQRFKVYISGQKRRVTTAIERDLRRRSAVEPCFGHLKSEHRMGRNHLAHATGDAANAVLAAAGCNFRRLLAWLAILLRVWLAAVIAAAKPPLDQSAIA